MSFGSIIELRNLSVADSHEGMCSCRFVDIFRVAICSSLTRLRHALHFLGCQFLSGQLRKVPPQTLTYTCHIYWEYIIGIISCALKRIVFPASKGSPILAFILIFMLNAFCDLMEVQSGITALTCILIFLEGVL